MTPIRPFDYSGVARGEDGVLRYQTRPRSLVEVFRGVALMLPRWNYLHMHKDVLPALKERGVTDARIHTMMVENPRRIFENTGAY